MMPAILGLFSSTARKYASFGRSSGGNQRQASLRPHGPDRIEGAGVGWVIEVIEGPPSGPMGRTALKAATL
ncbi:MAG: hypothetical protein EA397_06660, partial [Deltaproteobacteria bacterium]